MAQKFMAEFRFVFFSGRLSMRFEDSTYKCGTVTRRHFVFALGRYEAFIRFRA